MAYLCCRGGRPQLSCSIKLQHNRKISQQRYNFVDNLSCAKTKDVVRHAYTDVG